MKESGGHLPTIKNPPGEASLYTKKNSSVRAVGLVIGSARFRLETTCPRRFAGPAGVGEQKDAARAWPRWGKGEGKKRIRVVRKTCRGEKESEG